MRAAIIGYRGVVGAAQATLFGDAGFNLVTYDVADRVPYPTEIRSCDFAVVAVSTPAAADGAADLSHLGEAMDLLAGDGVPVLIRSTVPPGTTDWWQSVSDVAVAHCPEFLTERIGGPWQRSIDVPFTILGGDTGALEFFGPIVDKAYGHPAHRCSASAAELVKYTANLHWAAKVTFVNEMAGICETFGVRWEEVRRAWLADERVSEIYTTMDGYPPGFGGRCWPKDLSALIAAGTAAGHDPEFLSSVREANGRFTSE